VLREAAEHSPDLEAALQTWGEVRFEFDVVDKLARA
jgi:ribulose-bisphosphate carboxylase large chain